MPVKRVPQRTCVACRTTGGKKGLLRVVRLPNAAGVALDPTGKASGRGAYVCASLACVALAVKQKKLERSLKVAVPVETVDALKSAASEAEATGMEQAKQAEQAI